MKISSSSPPKKKLLPGHLGNALFSTVRVQYLSDCPSPKIDGLMFQEEVEIDSACHCSLAYRLEQVLRSSMPTT